MHPKSCLISLKNGQSSAFFRSFLYNFSQPVNVKNVRSWIRCWHSNSRSLRHDSSPITTRPTIPALGSCLILIMKFFTLRVFINLSVFVQLWLENVLKKVFLPIRERRKGKSKLKSIIVFDTQSTPTKFSLGQWL